MKLYCTTELSGAATLTYIIGGCRQCYGNYIYYIALLYVIGGIFPDVVPFSDKFLITLVSAPFPRRPEVGALDGGL
jgi:hypothetical protein